MHVTQKVKSIECHKKTRVITLTITEHRIRKSNRILVAGLQARERACEHVMTVLILLVNG